MSRRRAFMVEQLTPVYKLLNQQTVKGQAPIDTGISIWGSGTSSTILMDFTTSSNPTSGNSSAWKIAEIWNATSAKWAISLGKYNGSSSTLQMINEDVRTSLTGTSPAAGRFRIALTHAADSNTLSMQYKKDNGSVLTFTFTETYVATTRSIKIGGSASSVSSLPPGLINKFLIYNKIVDSDIIDEFFA